VVDIQICHRSTATGGVVGGEVLTATMEDVAAVVVTIIIVATVVTTWVRHLTAEVAEGIIIIIAVVLADLVRQLSGRVLVVQPWQLLSAWRQARPVTRMRGPWRRKLRGSLKRSVARQAHLHSRPQPWACILVGIRTLSHVRL
jgi:hypothetical protein